MAEPPRNRPRGRGPRKESDMRVADPDALHRARQLKGWSQRQLAALCRCTHTTIHLVETGKAPRVRTDLARDLARNLDLRLEVVFEDPSHIVAPQHANRAISILADESSR